MSTKLDRFISKEEAEKLLAKAIAKFKAKEIGYGEYEFKSYILWRGWYPSPHIAIGRIMNGKTVTSLKITSEEDLNKLKL